MSLPFSEASNGLRPRSLALVLGLALVACGDDSVAGGNGGGPTAGSNQGGGASGPGGNGVGAGPQGGQAAGGNGQGGTAEGGAAQGGAPQGGAAQGGSAQGGSAQGGAAQGGAPQGGAPEGGQGGGSGTPTIADLCNTACSYFAGCFGGSPTTCVTECSTDLGDCSAAQLDEVDACNQATMNDCDNVDAFSSCLMGISCIMGGGA